MQNESHLAGYERFSPWFLINFLNAARSMSEETTAALLYALDGNFNHHI